MSRDSLKGRTGASDQNTPVAGPAGSVGRPESETDGAEEFVYGEPRGPRPPRFTVLPKEVIEMPPAERGDTPPPADRYEAEEESVRGYYGGMSTPETYETTGDQQPKTVRRDLETFREQSDDDDDRQVER